MASGAAWGGCPQGRRAAARHRGRGRPTTKRRRTTADAERRRGLVAQRREPPRPGRRPRTRVAQVVQGAKASLCRPCPQRLHSSPSRRHLRRAHIRPRLRLQVHVPHVVVRLVRAMEARLGSALLCRGRRCRRRRQSDDRGGDGDGLLRLVQHRAALRERARPGLLPHARARGARAHREGLPDGEEVGRGTPSTPSRRVRLPREVFRLADVHRRPAPDNRGHRAHRQGHQALAQARRAKGTQPRVCQDAQMASGFE